MPVYHVPINQVEAALATSVKTGLSDEQVLQFRDEYGTNELEQAKKKNVFLVFLTHLFNSITFILYGTFSGCVHVPAMCVMGFGIACDC